MVSKEAGRRGEFLRGIGLVKEWYEVGVIDGRGQDGRRGGWSRNDRIQSLRPETTA